LALFALVLSSFSSVRRTFYEVFRYCHVFFAAVIVVAGFIHLTPIGVSKPSAILFIITASMYFLLFSMRTGMLILQRAPVLVDQGDGLLKIEIQLLKPISISAGQHIWLRIPSTYYTSFAESHPFVITSWEKAEDGKAKRITILVDPKRGFTRKLKMLVNHNSLTFQHLDRLLTDEKAESKLYRELGASANIEAKVLKELRAHTRKRYNQLENDIKAELRLFKHAFFDGPYGRPIRAEDFGTVILYATGIGIGAQLATVKHLLESREAGTAKTQRVTLLWEVDHVFVGYDAENEKHFVKNDTAQQMVKDLLQQDCDRLSRLRLDPAATFQYRSGWQGAPPEQGYVRSDLHSSKSVANHLKMFRCTRYVRNKPQHVELDLDENDEDNHSSTDTLRTRYRGLNPEASLESQLQHDNCRGRVLVSGEYLEHQITLLLTSYSLCQSRVRRFNP
jgi:NAD(P)H-flavin reductase